MRNHLLVSLRITIALLVITCAIYPALVWMAGQVVFPYEANGSLISRDGHVIGSALIAQSFSNGRYFHSRPSAIDYDAMNSGGSNLGPTSKKLSDRIAADAARIGKRVPADAVTTSASGLDPHVSPENARLQARRVARARNIDERRLAALISKHVEPRFLGIFGERRVNVLLLNLDLDRGVF